MNEINEQVKNAGFYYQNHGNQMSIRLKFKNRIISIPIHSIMGVRLKELLDVFEIDVTNGAYIKDITNRYCRLVVKENDKPIAFKHITEDIEFELPDL